METPMKLLVPVDGSAASDHAVSHAVWLVQGRPEATIVLLNVQNRETLGLSDINAEDEDEHRIAVSHSEKALRKAIGICQGAAVQFDTRMAFGPVVETIMRTARDVHADQIVMGTRGRGRLRSLVLGSVATGVVYQARLPVTLVK
jgi:nucleotide-binding universal stress UspA family protein